MRLTARQLNRSLLQRQWLLARTTDAPADALRAGLALQAQEPPSPYLALWNRVAEFDATHLDDALAGCTAIRATLVRLTLHIIHADDYTTMHSAMTNNLRASRLNDRRFTEPGFTTANADEHLAALLAFTERPRTPDEIVAMLQPLVPGRDATKLWWAYRTFAPLRYVPVGPPWAFDVKDRSFQTAPTEPPRPTHEEALGRLLWRYLEAFGPATANDFGQFALQRKPSVETAIAQVDDQLVRHEGPNGETLLDVPHGIIPTGDEPAPPRLLGMWDNVHLAHVDRTRTLADDIKSHVIRRNGDTLPTVMVDGRVAGVWRTSPEGTIEARLFTEPADEAATGLAAEAAALSAFLATRTHAIYRRYDHWWAHLPGRTAVLHSPT
ncbi:MAG TPA: hypothetical protein DCR14_17800 [Acidimicrobiaceae bacterium]|nr:hypothetical protein [Acidimicrobiaceae bacterium]